MMRKLVVRIKTDFVRFSRLFVYWSFKVRRGECDEARNRVVGGLFGVLHFLAVGAADLLTGQYVVDSEIEFMLVVRDAQSIA